MDLIKILKEIDSGKYLSITEMSYKLKMDIGMLDHAILMLKNMGYLSESNDENCSMEKCKYCSALESCSNGRFLKFKTYRLTETGKKAVKK